MKKSNNRFLVACCFAAALAVFAAVWFLARFGAVQAQVQAAEAQAQFERAAAAQHGTNDKAGPLVIEEPIGEEGKESMLSAALRFLIQGPPPRQRPELQPPAVDPEPAGDVGLPPGVGGGGAPAPPSGTSDGPAIGAGRPPIPGTSGTGNGSGGFPPSGSSFGPPVRQRTPGGPGMGPGAGGGMAPGMMGSGGGPSISPLEQLRQEYEAADREAHRLAQKLRDAGTTVPNDQQLRELHAAVTNAFTARQRMLRAELAELQKQVRGLESSIDTRDRAAGTIIGRRIEDLLNPNLRWEVPAVPSTELRILTTGRSAAATTTPSGMPPGMPTGMMPGGSVVPRAAPRPAALQGTWLAVQQGTNGELRPIKAPILLLFEDEKYSYRFGDDKPYSHGTWRSPPGPKDVNYFLLELTRLYLNSAGPDTPQVAKPHVEQMIAVIEGDRLRMCTAYDSKGKPTTEFATSPDDGRLLMVYHRVTGKTLSAAELDLLRQMPESDPSPPGSGGSAPGKTGSGTSNIPLKEHNFDKPPGNVEGDSDTPDLPGTPEAEPLGHVPSGGR